MVKFKGFLASVLVVSGVGLSLAESEILPVPSRPAPARMDQRAMAVSQSQARAGNPYAVTLGQPATTKIQQERVAALTAGTKPKIGFPRDVDILKTPEAVASLVPREIFPDGGQFAAISISSPDASGVRLRLLIESLPEEAILRFYAQSDRKVIDEVSGKEILEILKRNIDSGDYSDNARTYWTPLIRGSEAAVKQVLAAGYRTGDIHEAGTKRVSCTEMGDAVVAEL